MRFASLPAPYRIEDFDFSAQPGVDEKLIRELASLRFLHDAGNVLPTHSISAGLDYPAVGPEHAQLHDSGRVRYESVRDQEALEAFHLLAATEGILPALES